MLDWLGLSFVVGVSTSKEYLRVCHSYFFRVFRYFRLFRNLASFHFKTFKA